MGLLILAALIVVGATALGIVKGWFWRFGASQFFFLLMVTFSILMAATCGQR